MSAELRELGIQQLAPMLRERRLSPVELTEAHLARIAHIDARTNSYICVMGDDARAAARVAEAEIGRGAWRGPLHGVPIGLKDLFDVAGVPCTMGSKILRERVPTADATVTERLRLAGAIILGKHNLHEFAFGISSENPHFGPVRNPWSLDRIPGGSSGGTAAAIAAGLCVAGLGSDTGASIRAPASFCGIVGLKPTYARVSRAGVLPLAWSLDHVGPMARNVADCAIMLQAIAGADGRDPSCSALEVPDFSADLERGVRGLRLGVPRDHYFDVLEPDVDRLVREAIEVLAAAGAQIEEVSLPSAQHAQAAANIIMSTEAAAYHEPWLRERAADYGADVLLRIRTGALVHGTEYVRSHQLRAALQADFGRAFASVDAVVAPTMAFVAPEIGRTFEPGGPAGLVPRAVGSRLTAPCNLTGMPAISVPCGLSQGLPVGLQIMGPAFAEALVLRIARAYEAATPWSAMRPPLDV